MCGIAGIFHRAPGGTIDPAVLDRMGEVLRHRGPDDTGRYLDDGVGFAFTRLSIIDLAGGNQPHTNEEGTVVSICNGEIYNYKDLRADLERRGHRFRTACDVEVLVHLYEEEGAACVERLNGQFALALLDRPARRLLLARDHVGIAPLFHTRVGDAILFASEIKALLADPRVERRLDPTALDQILTFPGPVSPRTLFQGIHALPPGHLLLAENGEARVKAYWDLDYPPREALDETREEGACAEAVEAALREAVRLRLQADVPVGFYLSGGMDSSLIGSMIHSLSPEKRRHAFSIGFTDGEIDERRFQRIMAEHVGARHHVIEFAPEDIVERLPRVIEAAETPLKESYDTCSLALSESVRRAGLKVIQTGEGADELFAGYVGYRLDMEGRNGTGDLVGAEAMLEEEMRETVWGDGEILYERDFLPLREMKEALYADPLAAELDNFDCTRRPVVDPARIVGRHPLHQRSYIDFKLRIADHLLADHGDRVAYANSIEARYPFLDLGVIDAVRATPPGLLIRGGEEKYLLRRVSRRYLPASILDREKFSFVAPGSPFLLRHGADWVEEVLDPETIRRQGIFDPATVTRLRTMYADPAFSLNQTFDNDLLMVVLTCGLFLRAFNLSGL